MTEKIESEYVLKVDEFVKGLRIIDETLGTTDDLITRTGTNQSFDRLTRTVSNYNRVLSDGSRIYRQIEGNAKAYNAEIQRLTKAEKDLVKAQIEFKNGADYDEVEANLIAVRKRIEEIKAGLGKTGDTAQKTEGIFGKLGSVAKNALGLVAGFFAVDKLVDIEGSIIDATRTYEKYFAVLKNGFQDENKASRALELIYNFASKTPFSVNELTESFIKLNGRGFTPTEIEMKKLGDLASSQGKSFDQLTEAILDATSAEFERLKEFGISATTIGDKVTLSFRDQETTINKFNKGAIKDAILGFGELKGVAGAMGAVSETLDGQISNLSDSWEQLLTALGKSQGFLSSIVSLGKNVVDTLKSWVEVPIEQKIRGEQAELNQLVKSLILAGDNEELVGKIRAEIAQKYPSFLKLVDLERATNISLANALDLVNIQYQNKIKLAGLDVISQKNAGSKAKLIEQEGEALQKLIPLIERAGLTESKFLSLTKAQQKDIISKQINKQFGDGVLLERGINSGQVNARNEALSSLNTFLNFEKKYKEEEKSRRGLDALVKKQGEDIVKIEKDKVDAIKKQNEELKKQGILSEQALNKVLKAQKEGKKIGGTTQAEIDRSKTYYSNQAIIGTGLENYKNPALGTPPKPSTAPNTDTADKPQMKDRLEELEKLKSEEKRYADEIAKIQLDSENVRMQMLNKDSEEYLKAKLEYDKKVIDAEEKKYKEMYEIELENQLLSEELLKRKGEKIAEADLKILSEQAKLNAKKIANDPTNPNGFANASATSSQRAIIQSKVELATFQYFEAIKKIEEKAIKEQQERLELQNSLIGEGIEKQVQTINDKYNKLIEKYRLNAELVKQLESKRAIEIATANFDSSNKKADTSQQVSKATIEGRLAPAGINEVAFEQQRKEDLLNVDIEFYKKKLELLKTYLESEAYISSVANGQISKEQKDANEQMLKDLQTSLSKSTNALQTYKDTSLLISKKYADGWDLIGNVFEKLTGKVLKFAENPELDKAIKASVTNSLQSLKDSFSMILQMQIDNSQQRISVLENEVSTAEQLKNEEFSKYEKGLANNYEQEKANLDKKKQERDKEIQHKKKLQKEQAVIDNLTVISSNAVTVASTIEAAVKAFKAHSGIPFVGIALGLAAVATIIATIASVSAKAKQASRMRYGGKYGKVKGNLHEAGDQIEIGNTGIFVEGGEYVNRREVVKDSPEFFDKINDRSFKNLDAREQHRLLKPLGLKLIEARKNEAASNVENLVTYKTRKEMQQSDSAKLGRLTETMREVVDNTSRIPEKYIVSDSDGNLYTVNPKGRIIEKIQKP